MGLWENTRRNTGGVAQKVQQYTWKLDERRDAAFDANGNAQCQLAPGGARERWSVQFVAVNVTNIPAGSFNVPTMVMYRSAAVPGNQLGGTFSSTLDADSSSTYELNMGEPILFVFTGGDAGAIAHIHIEGIRYVWE